MSVYPVSGHMKQDRVHENSQGGPLEQSCSLYSGATPNPITFVDFLSDLTDTTTEIMKVILKVRKVEYAIKKKYRNILNCV